jgi:hypothetical protein
MARGNDVRYLVEAYNGDNCIRLWVGYCEAFRVFKQALNNPRIDRGAIWQDHQGDRERLESFTAITRSRHRMYQAQT